MNRHDYHVVVHDFQVIRIVNNIALAKCRCCSNPRIVVFATKKDSREFYYHGYDLQYAENLFNFLISKSQAK